MNRTLLFLLLTALITPLADARINWSRAECHKKYGGETGKPAAEIAPRLVESDEKAEFYEVGLVKIWIEYKDDKVWMITYRKKQLTDEKVEGILTRNNESEWKRGKFMDNRHYLVKDKGLHAVFYPYPTDTLVIMTDESLKSKRHPVDHSSSSPVAEPPKPGKDDKPARGKKDDLEGL